MLTVFTNKEGAHVYVAPGFAVLFCTLREFNDRDNAWVVARAKGFYDFALLPPVAKKDRH